MKNLLNDIRHVIRPLRWFLVFQFVVFLVLIVFPQGNDIYVNLFEDGFWENIMPTGLIFISLIFICSTSGIGTKLLTAIHPIQESTTSWDLENRKEVLKWIINFLWYFPLIVFLIGFLKAAILNFHLFAFSSIVWTIIFSVLTFKVIQKIRILLRTYLFLGIKDQFMPKKNLTEDEKNKSVEELIKNFDGLHSIFPDETQTAREKLIFIRDNYNPLLKILAGIFTWSVLLSIIFALLPIEHYHKIGAVALVIFGMGSWITFFYCIEIFDKIYKITLPLPEKFQFLNLKSIIFFWLCFCSFQSNHQVRQMGNIPSDNITESTLTQKLNMFEKDKSNKLESSIKKPLIFIDVDGGASRTGLFGALMLSTIADSVSNFKNQIFGYSNISGGTLGANVFMSLNPKIEGKDNVTHSELTKRFFLHDFISPLIGTFMFGELFGYFIPFPVEKFDRGVALEKSWELSWKNLNIENQETTLSEPFLKALNSSDSLQFTPVMLINSFEIETGKRAILSNIKLEEETFSGITNLNKFIKKPISYSSAIHLSARFPIISPTGEISNNGLTRHYGDGGYFETSGTLTLYELIRSLEDSNYLNKYDVYVIHCQYNADHTEDNNNTSNKLFTEFTDILSGAVNVRSGFTKFSTENLKNYINKKMGSGHYIELNVGNDEKDVPMNWVMSRKAVEIVQEKCEFHLNNNPDLKVLIKSLNDLTKSRNNQKTPKKGSKK